MSKHSPTDHVVLVHPDLPDVEIVRTRRQLPAYRASGWVEPKSPKAPAYVETQTPDTGTNPEEGPNDRNRT